MHGQQNIKTNDKHHNVHDLVGYLYVKDVISARKMIHIKMDLRFCFTIMAL